MAWLSISVTQEMRRLSIEVTKQEVRALLTAAEQVSASSHAECGYARGAWCCYQIWPSCNAYKYILQPVSLLCEPPPFVSSNSSTLV